MRVINLYNKINNKLSLRSHYNILGRTWDRLCRSFCGDLHDRFNIIRNHFSTPPED